MLLIAGNPHWAEVAGYIRHALPEAQKGNVPTQVSSELGGAALGAPPPLPTLYDAAPAEALLGIKYKSVQEMTLSSVRSMLKNGFSNSAEQYVPDK